MSMGGSKPNVNPPRFPSIPSISEYELITELCRTRTGTPPFISDMAVGSGILAEGRGLLMCLCLSPAIRLNKDGMVFSFIRMADVGFSRRGLRFEGGDIDDARPDLKVAESNDI
eukprot:CFRG3793T1